MVGKNVPRPPLHEAGAEAPESGSAEGGLYTAEDLFGDLVDAPLEPTAAASRSSERVKVQVAEKNRPPTPPERTTVDIPADEMAGLIDAFGDASAAAAPSQETPLPEPPKASASSIAPRAEFDSLLGSLEPVAPPPEIEITEVAPEPEPPAPPDRAATPKPAAAPMHAETPRAAKPTAAAEDFGQLLDNITEASPEPEIEVVSVEPEPFDALPSPESLPPLEPPAALHAPAAPPSEDAASLLDGLLKPAPAPPPRKAPAPEADVDALLAGFLDQAEPPSRPTEPDKPRTKIRVEPPKIARETVPVLDLGALADEAVAASLGRPEEPARAGRSLTPPASFGPYRLLERIAAGGMAEVFRAKRTGVEGFEKVLAVKRILPHLSDNKEFVEMFVDEAKMVAGLTHPNIVQIFDLGKLESTYFIAMEYVHGKDLRTILKRAKEKGLRIPLDLSVLVVSKVCSALEYAHRKRDESGEPLKIVHRDISPQNILISFEGEVKLTDFGIAKATSKAKTTDRGALRGKLLYMSPEQASGHPMDRRSDVFSLGVVFYEMITDSKPFLGSSEKGILEMVRDCRVEPPRSLNPKIPESLEKVVMKALEKDPERRYQDASEMYRGLERVLRERQPPAATELARFMEVLFETGQLSSHVGETSDEGIEIDLSPADPAAPLSESAGGGDEDVDFDDLIKRIGK